MRLRERLLSSIFPYVFSSTGCKVFQSGRKYLLEREGDFFLLKYSVSFSLFLLYTAVPCCASSIVQQYVQQAYQQRNRIISLPRVCTYIRHPRREASMASEPFSP